MMKRLVVLVALLALLLGSAAPADAGGRRGPGWGKSGFGAGFYYGPRYWGPRPWWGFGWYGYRPWPLYPFYGGFYYPYGYPYGAYAPYPAPVIVQQDPQVYIQQSPPVQGAPAVPDTSQSQPPQYWYYCEDARGYYPYVQQCPRGWMTVVPPAAQR